MKNIKNKIIKLTVLSSQIECLNTIVTGLLRNNTSNANFGTGHLKNFQHKTTFFIQINNS